MSRTITFPHSGVGLIDYQGEPESDFGILVKKSTGTDFYCEYFGASDTETWATFDPDTEFAIVSWTDIVDAGSDTGQVKIYDGDYVFPGHPNIALSVIECGSTSPALNRVTITCDNPDGVTGKYAVPIARVDLNGVMIDYTLVNTEKVDGVDEMTIETVFIETGYYRVSNSGINLHLQPPVYKLERELHIRVVQ